VTVRKPIRRRKNARKQFLRFRSIVKNSYQTRGESYFMQFRNAENNSSFFGASAAPW
jgi:hypothetical protein